MTSAVDSVLAYHERTKHYLDHYARSLGYLDWASQPIPFRRYEGAPCVTLEYGDNSQGPLYRDLYTSSITPNPITFQSISQLFYYSMALSAWKNIPGGKDGNSWSLRVNPSSGNLHPTESYLIIGPQASPYVKSGLYHYNSYHHALELRRSLNKHLWKVLAREIPKNGFFIGLSSIYWREAWKYGERAYRYCHHDVGHALGAITIAAASLGWDTQLIDSLTDKDISILLGIEEQKGIEAEHADCLILIYPNDKRDEIESMTGNWLSMLSENSLEEMKNTPLLGEINQLSENHQEWPIIDEVSLAARKIEIQHDNYSEKFSKLPFSASVLSQCNETAF
jgi:SagB-type dehydrogenase family enzyme